MKTIQGNILEIERAIICHQVNAQGVMGAGLALQIAHKFPRECKPYHDAWFHRELNLGDVIRVQSAPSLWLCHLVGQLSYGKGRQTDYDCYEREILPTLAGISKELKLPIAIPYKLGCGLAGGDWGIMEALLEEYVPDATIYRFEPEEKI